MICIHASLFAFYDLPSNYRKKIFRFIGKTASGALLNEKGPRGGGHENGTVVKLEDIKTFCSPIVIIVIEFM